MGIDKNVAKAAEKALERSNKKKKAEQTRAGGREDVPDYVRKAVTEFSERCRKNIWAVLKVEKELFGKDGLNRNELGRIMEFNSASIYTALGKGDGTAKRNEIGTSLLIRFSLALNIPVHLLVLPEKEFRKQVIANYRSTIKRAAKKN